MKKIIMILFLAVTMYSQTIIYEDSYFYADSVSSEVTLSRNQFLLGMFVPQGLTEYITFQISSDGTTYYPLANTDSTNYIVTIDSSQSNAIPLPEDKFRAWKRYKFLIDADIADTNSVKLITGNR